MKNLNDHQRGLLMTIFGVLVLTPDALLVRLIETDNWSLVYWRSLFMAFSLFALNGFIEKKNPLVAIRGLFRNGLFCALLFAGSNICFVFSITHTIAANTLVILACMPFIAAVLTVVLMRRNLELRTWMTIVLAMLGIVMVFWGRFGDGNILGAARTLAPYGVPLLGINRGRLGFLADVSPDEIEVPVGEVLAGNYTIEEHFLLEGEVGENGKHQITSALNEVVLHSASMAKMVEFDLYINDDFVYKQNSDGLIVSSPTGSTAYALSAGGPIMHPSLDAMVLIPMFPHTLNSRPLVVRGDSELKIVVGPELDANARVSFDSHVEFEVEPGDSIVIRKHEHKLRLIHPPGHSFYGVCRSKLDWASRVGD